MDVLIDGAIVLYGTVGDDLWGEGFTARDVLSALATIGRGNPVDVRINSGGGYTDDGAAIYNALRSHRGDVTVYVDGIAASAASVIAMAGDKIVMRRGATMMIHDPSGLTYGTATDHEKSIEMLNATANSMADIYAEQTGRAVDEIRAEMRDEIWLTADQAVEKGYADEIEASEPPLNPTAFNYSIYRNAPERVTAFSDVRPLRERRQVAALSAANRQQKELPMATEQKADKQPAVDEAALNEARASAEANGRKAGADEAKERIATILGSEHAAGRSDLARNLAFDTDLPAEKAVAALAAAPQERPKESAFEQRMQAAGNPKVGADAATADEQTEEAMAARIVSLVKKGA